MTQIEQVLALTGLTIAFYTLFRIIAYFKYRSLYVNKTGGQILLAFVKGLRFDFSIVLQAFAAPIGLLALPLPWVEDPRWRAVWLGLMLIVTIAMIFVLAADLIYFGDVQRHLTNEILMVGNDIEEGTSMVLRGYIPELAAFLATSAGLTWLYWTIWSTPPEPNPYPYLTVLVLAGPIFLLARGTVRGKAINIIDAFRSGDTILGNLALNGVFSAYHASRSTKGYKHNFMDEAEGIRIAMGPEYREPPLDPEYPLTTRLSHVQYKGYNIAFILLESWSSKFCDFFGKNNYGVTPNFDRLAAEGMAFTRFYAAGQRSIRAIQAVLSGVPVIPGAPQAGRGMETSNVLQLGHILRDLGYTTTFVKSSKGRSFRMDAVAKASGFQNYYSWEDMPMLLDYPDPKSSTFGWDYETLMFLYEQLKKTPQPHFTFSFTGTTHIPFSNCGPQFIKYPHSWDSENGFLNTLYYGDWSLGEFFKKAEKEPWFDNTIFIMTADTTLGYFQTSGELLDRYEIPLVIYAPKIIKPQVVDVVGSQLDLMPTILDLVGSDAPYSAIGQSLLRPKREIAFFEQGEIIGCIGRKGHLRHSLSNRLDASTFPGQTMTDAEFDEMEKIALAIDQTTYKLLRQNRWIRSRG